MKKRRIFVDMDGVIAKWNSEVSLEEVAMPGYFRSVAQNVTMVEAVKKLLAREEVEVFILSHVLRDNHSIADKNFWLNNVLPDIDTAHRIYVPYGIAKCEFLENHIRLFSDDVLLDDFSVNLHTWHGVGIKVLNGINGTHGTWRGYRVYINSDSEVIANTILGICNMTKVA